MRWARQPMGSTREETETSRRWRDAAVIAGYFGAVLLLAAALAPWMFAGARVLVDGIASRGWEEAPVFGYLHHHVGKADFTRVFNRAVLVSGLLCLWPAWRMLDVRRGGLCLQRHPRRWRHLGGGFLLGAGLLLALGAAYLGADLFVWKKEVRWGAAVRESLLRAAGAGIVEEWVFRGVLLGLLLRTLPRLGALLFITTLFAAVHFLQAPPDVVIRENVRAGTGFWLLGEILGTFLSANFILAEFATLWLAGLLLGWMRLRTRSLWLPVGLHAGWIFGIGLFASVAKASKAVSRDQWLPWVGETLKSGLVPLAVLALTGAVLALAVRPREAAPTDQGASGSC